MSQWSAAVLKFSKAIAHAENSPEQWCNPGSLTGIDAGAFRTLGKGNAEGVWIFASAEDGWSALYIKIDRIFRGKSVLYPLSMTIADFGTRYSGGNPNEGENIAAFLGISAQTTLDQFQKDNT